MGPSTVGCADRRLEPVLLLVLAPNATAFRLPLARRLDAECLAVVPWGDDSDALPDGPAELVRECLRFISAGGRGR